MTNQEAMAFIEKVRPKKCKMVDGRLQGGFPDYDSEIGIALDMAIAAMKKEIKMEAIEEINIHRSVIGDEFY